MPYRITIEEFEVAQTDEAAPVQRGCVKLYEQSVDALDLRRVIDAINYKKRDYSKRERKERP